MANCCGNWVEINGNPEQVKKFIELVGEEFDFQKVIPIGESSSEANEKWNCSSIAFDTQYEGEIKGDYPNANWYFWTKWNAPTLIYEKLCEMFPDIFIYWRYEEPGMGLYGFLNGEDI